MGGRGVRGWSPDGEITTGSGSEVPGEAGLGSRGDGCGFLGMAWNNIFYQLQWEIDAYCAVGNWNKETGRGPAATRHGCVHGLSS